MNLKKIATIHTDFPEKFGIPRQSGLADTEGILIFEPEYRHPDAIRGIEVYTHLWLIWGFSKVSQKNWHATVRPPRLGGNVRVGVFACRSPYRPNPLGLSSVRLMAVEHTEQYGCILRVSGIDMLDQTPIYDIKPYLPYVDAHPEAAGGFAHERKEDALHVSIPEKFRDRIPEEKYTSLCQILSQDPRPSYQDDPDRIYGMQYAGMEVKFTVTEGELIVVGIDEPISKSGA